MTLITTDPSLVGETEKSPAFQFYPSNFLSDINVVRMKLDELGAYWKLISHAWVEKSLPNDVAVLARVLGISQRKMEAMMPAIAPCFRVVDGRLVHPTLEQERSKQAEFREKQTRNGQLGGRPRKAESRNPNETQTKGLGLEGEKGLGYSGLTQTKPKKTSISLTLKERTNLTVSQKARKTAVDLWSPNDDHRAIAIEEGRAIEREDPKFRDHALNRKIPYLDLDAGFRNWLRNDLGKPPKNGSPKPRGGRDDEWDDSWTEGLH